MARALNDRGGCKRKPEDLLFRTAGRKRASRGNDAIAGIDGASIEKRSGDATSLENVITYGLNAAALVRANAQLLLINSEITAVPLGAGGAFACGGRLQLETASSARRGFCVCLAVSQEGSVSARNPIFPHRA
jgi:hypothetical protein